MATAAAAAVAMTLDLRQGRTMTRVMIKVARNKTVPATTSSDPIPAMGESGLLPRKIMATGRRRKATMEDRR
jgi:hypothetical protein